MLSFCTLSESHHIVCVCYHSSELFDHLNKTAVGDELDGNFIDNLIQVVTSKQLENFTIDGKVFRYSILTICQKNYQIAENYKKESLSKFYNSIKLLGGVFNKLRTAQGQTYNILGQSLLKMLNNELDKELKNVVHFKSDDFAKLILSQVNTFDFFVLFLSAIFNLIFLRSPSTAVCSNRDTRTISIVCSTQPANVSSRSTVSRPNHVPFFS